MKNTAFLHIPESIENLRREISEAEAKYGRESGSVSLLAVSKTRTTEEVQAAINIGQRDFGENYYQDAMDKIEVLGTKELQWHFIGPLQSNKCKGVAEHFAWVHTIDRFKIAQRLNQLRPEDKTPLNVCIQLNISGEASKSGIKPEDCVEFADKISELENITLRGLMALPAPSLDFDEQRQAFAKVRNILLELQHDHPQLDTLSLGTTNDMQAAIAEGSTMVRIGTAIFGPRNQ